MSLETGPGKSAAGEDVTAANTANQHRQQGFEPQRQSGIAGLRANLQNPMARSTASEAVNRFKEAFLKALGKEGEGVSSVKILTLDGNIRGSALSSLLLCRAHEGRVAVANLILEASNPNLAPTEISIGQSKIELPTVPGDVNNPAYWDKIRAVVREAYGEVEVLYGGGSVIPLEMKSDDEARIRTVLYYADTGVYNTLVNAFGIAVEPFNISMLTSSGIKVATRRDFAPVPFETATGLPIRADFSVLTTASENTKSPLESGATELARLGAYADILYMPPDQAGLGQIQPTQHYYVHIIATAIEPVTDRITLELQLFAIAQLALLSKNLTWANAFRNRESITGTDLRDIGAIGYDVPAFAGKGPGELGARIDTKSPNFTNDMFYTLVATAFRPNPIYSFDIEETGEMSWLNLVFVAAANGDDAANRAIIQAADNLTGGNFSKLFKGGPLFWDNENVIHFGHYVDRDTNTITDIRTIDYLAMLNIAGQNEYRAVLEYAETFDNTTKEAVLRLEKRLRIQERLAGPTLRITGKGRRVTVAPGTMDALVQSIVNAGLVINPDNIYTEFNGQSRRGNEHLARLAYGGTGFNNLFNHNNNGVQPGVGFGGQYRYSGSR